MTVRDLQAVVDVDVRRRWIKSARKAANGVAAYDTSRSQEQTPWKAAGELKDSDEDDHVDIIHYAQQRQGR